jgi:Spy/CpxP family protein refolding chaperone
MRLAAISAVVIAALAGGAVLAHEGAEHHAFFRRHINARIEAAIDAAKATPQQRARLEQARDRVFATIEASHQNQRGHMQKILQLFEADRIDPAAVQALRTEHEKNALADSDAIVSALSEAHDVLEPAQRHAVAEWVRSHKPAGPRPAMADWFKKRAFAHVNEALDAVKASPEQRNAVEAALEQVWTTVHEEHLGQASHIDEAVKLFEADRIDRAQLDQLRAQKEARQRKIGDSVVQAFHDVHDALTSAQRKQLVAWVRTNHHPM